MANILGSGFVWWDTAVNAAFDGTNGPRNPLVTSIIIDSAAVGGVTTLTVDGDTWYSQTVPANATIQFNFAKPQYMKGLAMTAVGTNVTVTVNFA